jgi:hypothetical protein
VLPQGVKIMFSTRRKVALAVLFTAVVLAGGVRGEDPPKKDDKGSASGPPTDSLRARLRKFEEELGKIRQAMLKEVAAEEQRLEEARKKAKEDMDKAKKGKDKDAYKKAAVALHQAAADRARVTLLRADVEKRIRVGPAPAAGKPIDERLGLKTTALPPLVREQFGLSKDEGLAVEKVAPDSVAAKIGLKANDILLKIDGQQVPGGPAPFRTLLTGLKSGKSVEVVVLRRAKQETLKGMIVPPPE